MKPEKLIICGWGPYKNVVEVDFKVFHGRGLFLITGATGSGKTTIFDAITYALYGALSGEQRDKEKDSVRSDFAESDTPTYVELVMEHGGETYRIHRNPEYLRPKRRAGGGNAYTKERENAVLYLPDGKVVEGVKEVNGRLKELLVLDIYQFKQLSMIAQGEFARLLTAPPKEKTKIFREIFSTGVYERFTARMGARSRKAFCLVQEQQHRLEEDIRLLLSELGRMRISEERKQALRQCTEGEAWNYELILRELAAMETEAKTGKRESEKCLKGLEEELEQASSSLAKQQDVNKRFADYRIACQNLRKLESREEEYRLKQLRVQASLNAGFVESAERDVRAAASQMKKLEAERKRLAEELSDLEKRLLAGQAAYLKSEERERQIKGQYEAALRAQRHAAVGIAAKLLRPGEPCPVCGSTEHPSPAACQEGVVSEEELERLKEAQETAASETVCRYEAVVRIRAGIQEKQSRDREKQQELEEARREQERSGEIFALTLEQYHFPDEAAYHAAHLDQAARERMTEEISVYHKNLAAGKELCIHLQEGLKGLQERELTLLEGQVRELRRMRDAAQAENRQWEQELVHIRRTTKQAAGKQEEIRTRSTEYGRIRELENIANGNNAKKLVFEQYVLAGYFEEILRAANIRFYKMTSGRYEMRRTKEVGDGRTKDNLEIEVLDYYTGRSRSVRTLSGGESFKASLSLALGLSDVIQAMSGGIRVDTLFIDEGFGALDSESLDQACETLMGLVESDRLIGIISHVQELRERIPRQILIDKTAGGSTLHIRTDNSL